MDLAPLRNGSLYCAMAKKQARQTQARWSLKNSYESKRGVPIFSKQPVAFLTAQGKVEVMLVLPGCPKNVW